MTTPVSPRTLHAVETTASRQASPPSTLEDYLSGPLAFGQSSKAAFVAAFVYLLLPTLVVLVSFSSWKIAVPVAVCGVACLAWCWKSVRFAAPRQAGRGLLLTWPYLLLAAGFVWLSGVMPPFAENQDWTKHYALFNTLIGQSWPPAVPTETGLATLRYSLSYYVLPGLVAKLFGHAYLGAAVFVWSTLGLYLSLVLAFGSRMSKASTRFILATVFLLFSGADIIGTYVTGAIQLLPMHYEWWAGFGELPSTITSLFWTPQHALSAWVGLFLVLRFPRFSLQAAAPLGAAIALWSPFSAIGLVPFFAWALFKEGPRTLLTWINAVAGVVLLLAAAHFLTRGSGGIPAGFIWNAPGFSLWLWCLFLMLEFGLIALSLLVMKGRNGLLIALCAAWIAFLALFYVGAFNDLLMRASIPALGLLAMLAAVGVAFEEENWRKAPLIVCLVIGLVTPLGEIMRGISGTRIPGSGEIWLPDIVGGRNSYLAPQYLVPGYGGKVSYRERLSLNDLHFAPYGNASVDVAHLRVESDQFTDGGLVTEALSLPKGLYEVELIMDWDVKAENPNLHGAHVSLYGDKILIPIVSSTAQDRTVRAFFRSVGKPIGLAFGIGGWTFGKGSIRLKGLTVRSVTIAEH